MSASETGISRSESPGRILVVDDEPEVARVISLLVESLHHHATIAETVESAREKFASGGFEVVLTDLRLGRGDGIELVRHFQRVAPEVPVVVITGQATIDSAMEAIRFGAYDYLSKPIEREAMRQLLHRALARRRSMARPPDEGEAVPALTPGPDLIVGRSPQMLEVYKTVARVAAARSSVLILGESGTGKELVARELHSKSPRAHQPFVPVNVSAIPDTLLESTLFGHVRGAFTDAHQAHRGLFETAHQGTLFLDEIGDLSPRLQAKLLRVIQEQSLTPVGGNEQIQVDVRIVAATHRALEEMLRRGSFREDLYFRLNVVSISLPPLRERVDDIPLLVDHFLLKYAEPGRYQAPSCTVPALAALMDYAWPGNVRELENVMERAVLLASGGPITPDLFPPHLRGHGRSGSTNPAREMLTLQEMTEQYVSQILEQTGGNRSAAARILGVSTRTLQRMDERKRRARFRA